jgi:hypothetical protein
MAREAGLLTWLNPPEDVIERFKAFEALVRADEREACIKIAEEKSIEGLPEKQPTGVNLRVAIAQIVCGTVIADAIRVRGNT